MTLWQNPIILTEDLMEACRQWFIGAFYQDATGNYRWHTSPEHPRSNIVPWNRELRAKFANAGLFSKYATRMAWELGWE